jgi:SAM-dependent methyltransferase
MRTMDFRRVIAFIALLCCQGGGRAQTAVRVHPVTGRVIASTMSVEGADWLERPEREGEERPEKAIQPGGTYYANDIQPGMLARLRANATAQKVANLKTILGTQADPALPARSLDYVLMVDVYHELSDPQVMLRSIAKSLKPDGELVLLEFRKEDPNVPIRAEHKMSTKEIVAELSAEHYTLDHKVETLPWQHILFFRQSK